MEHGQHSSIFLFSTYCFFLCRSVYCLCVNVCCTTAPGCYPITVNKYIISYHIASYRIVAYHIISSCHVTSRHVTLRHIIYHIIYRVIYISYTVYIPYHISCHIYHTIYIISYRISYIIISYHIPEISSNLYKTYVKIYQRNINPQACYLQN